MNTSTSFGQGKEPLSCWDKKEKGKDEHRRWISSWELKSLLWLGYLPFHPESYFLIPAAGIPKFCPYYHHSDEGGCGPAPEARHLASVEPCVPVSLLHTESTDTWGHNWVCRCPCEGGLVSHDSHIKLENTCFVVRGGTGGILNYLLHCRGSTSRSETPWNNTHPTDDAASSPLCGPVWALVVGSNTHGGLGLSLEGWLATCCLQHHPERSRFCV